MRALPSWERPRIPSSFPDGTTNTILFTEHYARCRQPVAPYGPIERLWTGDNSAFSDRNPPQVLPRWDGTANPMPNPAVCLGTRTQTAHTGVVNVCLADASVRAVSVSLNPETWYRALRPNDGKPMPGDW
jgi:hypothetical protein